MTAYTRPARDTARSKYRRSENGKRSELRARNLGRYRGSGVAAACPEVGIEAVVPPVDASPIAVVVASGPSGASGILELSTDFVLVFVRPFGKSSGGALRGLGTVIWLAGLSVCVGVVSSSKPGEMRGSSVSSVLPMYFSKTMEALQY